MNLTEVEEWPIVRIEETKDLGHEPARIAVRSNCRYALKRLAENGKDW